MSHVLFLYDKNKNKKSLITSLNVNFKSIIRSFNTICGGDIHLFYLYSILALIIFLFNTHNIMLQACDK